MSKLRLELFVALCVTPVLGLLIVATDGNDRFAIVAAASFSFLAGWTVKGVK